LESEADTWHSEAQAELKQAETLRAEAEANRNSAQQSAMRLETEAEAKYAEAEAELKRAESNRVQAEADRERILADSHRAARAVLDEARMESDRDRMESERVCLDLKRQASVEAQGILAQARTTREELEAQRIYADAARLKAWSQDILMQVEEQPAEAPVSSKPSTNGNTASPEPANGAKSAVLAQAAIVETAPSEMPSKQDQPKNSGNAKRPARRAKAAK